MVVIDNLTKKYGDFELNISMEIKEGCITGLVGKNGAGKSTTIKSVLGLISADSGSVRVFGNEASKLTSKDKERLGVALSETGFSPYLNIKDVSKILAGMYKNFDKNEFLNACKKNGLPENKIIKNFSTGMKAKLRVLVALSHKADLLVLDEPTAGLDVEARNEVLDILRNYLELNEGGSILITSHIATDLENLCDDIYMINDGKIILHEETDVILSDYAVLKVDDMTYQNIDKSYLLNTKKELFGYVCLTNQKQFYLENYPGIIIEKSGIDDLILIMTGGEK